MNNKQMDLDLIETGSYSDIFIDHRSNILLKKVKLKFSPSAKEKFKVSCIEKLIIDMERHRTLFSNFYPFIPTIYSYKPDYNLGMLYITETYCGLNILNSTYRNKPTFENIINVVYRLLFLLPHNIYIDANPKNFTILNNCLYYVDFTPPILNIDKDLPIYADLFDIYSNRTRERSKRRLWRYTNPEGRISKFNYYLKKYL